ncbi:MAG: hypothetical protein J6A83_09725 [Clostridia bacterium]|nr:hypothetical protein [Clostridia bacterium]MBP3369989.1 hypothetical protein [Clostridia bacterium]
MNKRVLKLICLVLALCLTLIPLSSCKKSDGDGDGEETTVSTSGTGGDGKSDYPFEGVDLGGKTMTVLCQDSDPGNSEKILTYCDFFAKELNNDPINDGIYYRNQEIENALKCKLEIMTAKRAEVGTMLRDQIISGNTEIDLAYLSGVDVNTVLHYQYLADLMEIDTLNLRNEWWNQSSNRDLRVGGCQYLATGDFSSKGLLSLSCIFFNTSVMETLKYPADTFYDMVRNDQWTIDKLKEFANVAKDDKGNDGTISIDDRAGFVSEYGATAYYIVAAGQRAYKNTGTTFEVGIYGNDIAGEMVNKFITLLCDTSISMNTVDPALDGDYTKIYQQFKKGNIAFFSHTLYDILDFRSMDMEFGILPLPMYSTSQGDYYTISNRHFSCYMAIPAICSDISEAGILGEAMAYYGRTHVRGVVYDKFFTNAQLVRDEDSIEMFDLIVESQVQDFGFVATTTIYDIARTMAAEENPTGFLGSVSSQKTKIDADLEKVIEGLI